MTEYISVAKNTNILLAFYFPPLVFPCNNQSRPNNWFEDFWKDSPPLVWLGLSIDIDTAFSPLLRPGLRLGQFGN